MARKSANFGVFARGAVAIAALACAPGAATGGGLPCSYDVTVIQGPTCPWPFLNPPVTTVTGLNERGHVCGYYEDCDKTAVKHPFIWSPETGMVTIPIPPGVFSVMPADINDHDVICGTYSRPQGFRGFVYDHGVWTELPPPFPQGRSDATAINNAGVVCGRRSIGPSASPYNAFVWSTKDGFIDLGLITNSSYASSINESNDVVGRAGPQIGIGQQGFVWSGGKPRLLPEPHGCLWFNASTINASGVIVGGATYPNPEEGGPNITRGISWRADDIVTLDPLPGYLSSGSSDLNDDGVVVGRCLNPDTNQAVGAIWFHYSPIMVTSLIHNPVVIDQAKRINEDAVILAAGVHTGYPAGFKLTPVYAPLGDLTCDGIVHTLDLGILLASWSIPPTAPGCQGAATCPGDMNRDGVVNSVDLGILLGNWTTP